MKLLTPEGRRALLEFLRNLTPQILLLSTAAAFFISAEKPEAKSPFVLHVLGVGLVVVWFMAFLANFENFLNAAFSDAAFIGAEKRRLMLVESGMLKRTWLFLSSIAKHSKKTFAELVLTLGIIYASMFCVIIGAIWSALRMSR